MLGSVRRFYLAKRHAAAELCDTALELVWKAKQLAEPGTSLPSNFPFRARLEPIGYVAVEDIAGADSSELTAFGFSTAEAAAIIAAAS